MTNQLSELQEFLNKCIEMGWRPRGYTKQIDGELFTSCGDKIEIMITRLSNRGKFKAIVELFSYHDLFSVDSGLMQFVSRGEGDRYTALWQMCGLDKEGKIKYFLSHALLPTQD